MHERGEQRRRQRRSRRPHRSAPISAGATAPNRSPRRRPRRRPRASPAIWPGAKRCAIAGEQQHRAGEAEQRADDVMRRSRSPGKQRGEQHDQQRPEIIEQPGFGRRREAQRQEIQRVIAEQAADADDPGHRRLPQRATASARPIQVSAQAPRRSRRSSPRAGTAGIFPVATVSTASSDHIRIAVRPISVAVRGDIITPSWPGIQPCASSARIVPAIHVSFVRAASRRGCPAQGRA